MKERILEFLKAENKTSAQFAEEIGVQPSGISHILSGRNNPSLDFVTKMLEKYKFISPEWLLFGRGDMYRDQSMRDLFSVEGFNGKVQDRLADSRPGERSSEKQAVLDQSLNIYPASDVSDPAVTVRDKDKKIEKIIWFYSDMSFRAFSVEK